MAIRKRIAEMAISILISIPLAATVNTLSTQLFQGKATTVGKKGKQVPVTISIQSWGLSRQEHVIHDIPLRGFYVAHLLTGHIAETIQGQTTEHLPGDYWTVKDGATMQVNVLGQSAVLETIVTSK